MKNSHSIFMILFFTLTSCVQQDGSKLGCEAMECDLDCGPGMIEVFGECVVNVNQDQDADGVPDQVDNCPTIANADQNDCDQDAMGDLCDEESNCGTTLAGYISRYEYFEESDLPLKNALVEVVGSPSYTATDEMGQYRLANLNPGSYNMLIFAPESERLNDSPAVLKALSLEIQPQISGTQQNDILIGPPGNIIGGVKFADKPIFEGVHGGVGVYLKGLPFHTAITDRGGQFELRRIPSGPQTLRFVYPGYDPVDVEVEVIGLSTIRANSPHAPIVINRLESDEHWDHEVELIITDYNGDESSLVLNLEPVFPHLSESVTLTLSGMSAEEGVLRLTANTTHLSHDVFNTSVTSQVKRTSVYHIDSPDAGPLRKTTLISEGAPELWEDYSDRLLASNSLPINGSIPTGPQEIEVNEFMSPLPLEGDQGDLFTLYSVTSDHSSLSNGQTRKSSWRFPLSYQKREIMLSLTPSAEIVFETTDPNRVAIEEMSTYELSFGLMSTSSRRYIKVAVASEPCSISTSDCDFIVKEIDLATCTLEENQERRCDFSVNMNKAHPSLRMWIFDEVIGEELDDNSLPDNCNHQCFNEFGIDVMWASMYPDRLGNAYPVPLYPLLARAVTSREAIDCSNEDRKQRSETLLPQYCFPNLPRYYPDTERNSCLPQPIYGPSGRPLMIIDAEVVSLFGSDGLLSNLSPNNPIRVDLNGINPLIKYSLDCFDCSGGYWANGAIISVQFTDGVDIMSYTIEVSHESESGTPSPYCWSFEYDPQLNFGG